MPLLTGVESFGTIVCPDENAYIRWDAWDSTKEMISFVCCNATECSFERVIFIPEPPVALVVLAGLAFMWWVHRIRGKR